MLDEELKRIVNSAVSVVVFDLAGLEYISSSGLRSIFSLQKVMTARSGKAILANPQASVQKVLQIATPSISPPSSGAPRSSIGSSTRCSER